MFLHEEALATAADLARTIEVRLTDDVRERYAKILRDSTEAALQEKKPGRNVQGEVLKQRLG